MQAALRCRDRDSKTGRTCSGYKDISDEMRPGHAAPFLQFDAIMAARMSPGCHFAVDFLRISGIVVAIGNVPCHLGYTRCPGSAMKTRREFLSESSLGIVGATVATPLNATALMQEPGGQTPAGMPPAFGTGTAVGPAVS